MRCVFQNPWWCFPPALQPYVKGKLFPKKSIYSGKNCQKYWIFPCFCQDVNFAFIAFHIFCEAMSQLCQSGYKAVTQLSACTVILLIVPVSQAKSVQASRKDVFCLGWAQVHISYSLLDINISIHFMVSLLVTKEKRATLLVSPPFIGS